MSLLRSSALGLLGLCVASCGRCDDEPRVPFKLPQASTKGEQPPPLPRAEERADAALNGRGAVRAFVPAIDQPVLGDAAVPLAKVHAALEQGLGRRENSAGLRADDALVLSEDDSHGVHLSVVSRTSAGWSAPREVAYFAQPEETSCTVASARIETLSATKALVMVERACGETPPGMPLATLLLLSLESTPRVYERISVLAPPEAGGQPLTFAPESIDADGDGHDDVLLTVRYEGTAEGDALRLVWLDRPSGLVRDAREPEATLAAWAAAAESLAAKAPRQALERAELALSLERALCRELGSAQVALSGSLGVPCQADKSTSQLLATVVAAKAWLGDVSGAFAAYRALSSKKPPPRTLAEAAQALSRLKPTTEVTLRRGPLVEAVRRPPAHLPSARFLSESLLYVHRPSPVLYDLERAEESPAASALDPLLRDPSGQLVATAIERRCEGISARIERAPPRGSEYISAPALAWALILPLPSAPGCTRSGGSPENFGYQLLGWAPQGLVAVRGSEVRLLPMSSDGRPHGPPRLLAPTAPRPAPLPAGSATTDGSHYVEATPQGVLVYGPSSTDVALWRPAGYEASAQEPLEAAISPSARRVAVVSAGTVYILEQR